MPEFPDLRPSRTLRLKGAINRWHRFATGADLSDDERAAALHAFAEARYYLFVPTMYGFAAFAFGADWWKILTVFGMVFLMTFFQLAARRIEQLGVVATLAGIAWLVAGHDVVVWALASVTHH